MTIPDEVDSEGETLKMTIFLFAAVADSPIAGTNGILGFAPSQSALVKVSVPGQLSTLYGFPMDYYRFHFVLNEDTDLVKGYITFSSTL